MSQEPTPQEKSLIEREFVARQEESGKRRSFARLRFLVGISSGGAGGILRGLQMQPAIATLLGIVWLLCLLIYAGGRIFLSTFAKDLDPRWHMNPWQEALQNLSEGRTLVESIALLAGPTIVKIFCSFLYLGFK